MININDKHHCCGCEACVQSCPKQCISFKEDVEGFLYPQVDKSICIDCGLCEKVCPVLNQAESSSTISVYAAKNTKEEDLVKSSSGGVFILLANYVLSQGGVVFGAKFDKDWNVIHSYAETEEEAHAFMGSKYVQSRIGNTFHQARVFLKQGRKVLFSGTPCQIAGFKRFLRKDYDNLLTVDVICHGVPSPKVWNRYIDEIIYNACKEEITISDHQAIDKSADVQIENISFRDKRISWKEFCFSITLAKPSVDDKKNTVSQSHIFREDPYMKLFLRNLILRPSCYQCPSKTGKSQSDFTIADFWGIERSHPDFDDERGVGLMMVNSEKGLQATSSLQLKTQKVSFTDAISGNPMYTNSVAEPLKRKQCFCLLNYSDKSMEKIVNILYRPPFTIRAKQRIKNCIYSFLRIKE